MTQPIRIGDIVHGYLDGWFGRDHYNCSRVEAIGADWAIIRTVDQGVPCTGSGPGILDTLAEGRNPTVTEHHDMNCPAAGDGP